MAKRKCPFCAEVIQAKAIKCKHCGSPIEPSTSQIGIAQAVGIGLFFVVGISVCSSVQEAFDDNDRPSKRKIKLGEEHATPPDLADPHEGEAIVVPTDSKATYSVIDMSGTRRRPVLTTKRIGPSGTTYSRRLFDCRSKRFKYLGDADTLEGLSASKPDKKMGRLVPGSISDFWWRFACAK